MEVQTELLPHHLGDDELILVATLGGSVCLRFTSIYWCRDANRFGDPNLSHQWISDQKSTAHLAGNAEQLIVADAAFQTEPHGQIWTKKNGRFETLYTYESYEDTVLCHVFVYFVYGLRVQ